MMTFYMTPGSCTTGIHILLEEVDVLFQVELVNLMKGDHENSDFLALNPKGTIPVLTTDDGDAFTDFTAIAWWLARKFPKADLLPEDREAEIKVLDVMSYTIATIHMQGFARLFTTDKFTPGIDDYEWVKQQGRDIVNKAFKVLNSMFSESGYVLERFSIADAAVFYVEFWAMKTNILLPENCMKHYQLMLQRPAVQRVMIEEGYGKDLA